MQGVQLDSFVPQIQTKQISAQKFSGEGESFLEMVHSQQSKIEETSKEKNLGLKADSDSEKDEKLEKSEKSEKSPAENKNAENAVLALLKNGQMEEIPAEKIDLTDELKNLSLEDSLEFLADDEYMEVTPKSIRIRKVVLDHNMRLRIRGKALQNQD